MIYISGIKPTGDSLFHLGHYVSMIKPIKNILTIEPASSVFIFIADVHALNEQMQPEKLRSNIKNIKLSLFALLNDEIKSERVFIYSQSDIPEIFEFSSIIANFCKKGMLNKSHAYKARVMQNVDLNRSADEGINTGLFCYPLLVSADILSINADKVIVGKDQLSHVELIKYITNSINSHTNKNILKTPIAEIANNTVLPGIDGRKMSKSYKNTISIFENKETIIKKVKSIVTNNKLKGESKDINDSPIAEIYKQLSTPEEFYTFSNQLNTGICWSEAKDILVNKILGLSNNINLKGDTKSIEIEYEEISKVFLKNIIKPKINENLYALKQHIGLI